MLSTGYYNQGLITTDSVYFSYTFPEGDLYLSIIDKDIDRLFPSKGLKVYYTDLGYCEHTDGPTDNITDNLEYTKHTLTFRVPRSGEFLISQASLTLLGFELGINVCENYTCNISTFDIEKEVDPLKTYLNKFLLIYELYYNIQFIL